MDEVKVEVVELEIVPRTFAGIDERLGSMAIIPDFGVDPKLVAGNARSARPISFSFP
jgi:hypothetical protein